MRVRAVSVSRCLEAAVILSHSALRVNAKVVHLLTTHVCSPDGIGSRELRSGRADRCTRQDAR